MFAIFLLVRKGSPSEPQSTKVGLCGCEDKSRAVPLWSDVGVDGVQRRQRVKPHHRLCGHILRRRHKAEILERCWQLCFLKLQLVSTHSDLTYLPGGSDNFWQKWQFLF